MDNPVAIHFLSKIQWPNMKKALILVVLIAFLLGPGFVERIDAAVVCELCNIDSDCKASPGPASKCTNDPNPNDGKKQGICQEPGKTALCNPLQTNFTGLIGSILNFLFNIAIILSPIMVVIAGVLFVTAAGKPEQISKAKQILIWTAVGFGVILLSRGLITIIEELIGF